MIRCSLPNESWLSRHRLSAFFCLAYLLSWYPWIIALARGQTTGPNPLGPFLAAVIIAALTGGKQEVKALLGRIVRARVGWRWYAFVFGMPIALCLVAMMLTNPLLRLQPTLPSAEKWRELPERFIFIFLFIGLGEEPGWRGFALPQLQKRHSPLIASLILAPLWALWHLPLIGNEFPLHIVPAFLISLLGGTLIQTWLFNRTEGSVLLQMLFHAMVNTVGTGLLFPLFTGTALTLFWSIYALLWLGAGLGLLLFRPSKQEATASLAPAHGQAQAPFPETLTS